MSRPLFSLIKHNFSSLKPIFVSNRACSAFKSSIHTDNLYPGSDSNAKFAKFELNKLPTKDETFSGFIPMNELQFSYSHSSGPGGQNVNKVSIFFLNQDLMQLFVLHFSF